MSQARKPTQQEIALIDLQYQTLVKVAEPPVQLKAQSMPKAAAPRKLKFKREEPTTKYLFDVYGAGIRDQPTRRSS
jgi:hypothetical protein